MTHPFQPAHRKILLVSAYANPAMRATSREHLFAFRKYSEDNVYYLNLVHKSVPSCVCSVDFDLIVFHTFFLTAHWRGREYFRKLTDRAGLLKMSRAVKVMLPQDEFIHSDLLSEFIDEFSIDHVFSVAPPSAWKAIYRGVHLEKVKYHHVLTGYFDEERLMKISAVGRSRERPVDIGYRTAGTPPPWFGRHGYLKQQIAEIFLARAPEKGLKVDISTRSEDTIPGDAWYDFLANCKYTLGVESGTSLIDPDGAIRKRTETYLAAHPEASFSEVEEACFPGLDGRVQLYAISPRHLEACATRTCQILTEGDYGGILQGGVHYLPLKKDFSNIDDILSRVANDFDRKAIVERAYTDIVTSGRFTYRDFVTHVVETSLGDKPASNEGGRSGAGIYHWMNTVETLERMAMKLLYPFKRYLKQDTGL